MRQHSIAELMGLVAFCALSFAALSYPNVISIGGMRLLTFAAMGASILGIIYRGGETRAACIGFTIFAAGFWALPVLPDMVSELPINQVIRCQSTVASGVVGALIARKLSKSRHDHDNETPT